jgi:hypothetical protein
MTKKKNDKFFLFISIVSWSIWSKWYQKHTSQRLTTSTYPPAVSTNTRTITKKTSAKPQMYIVKEIDDSDEEREQAQQRNLKFNSSNPASFGINWDRISYNTGFNHRVAAISSLLILLIPILLVS